MVKQILTALENSTTDYVFFTEHDVLYPKCHFDFTPPRDDIFYYNANVWRWFYPEDTAITHDRMLPLSSLWDWMSLEAVSQDGPDVGGMNLALKR